MERLGQGRMDTATGEFEPALTGSLLRITPRLSANVNHVIGIDYHERVLIFTDGSRQDASEHVISLVEQHLSGQSNQRQNAGIFDFPDQGIGGLGYW
ncbi:MAG: hypothetical protein AAGA46_03395 [Cyanobacteria bacterium P01_F01_bin.13]